MTLIKLNKLTSYIFLFLISFTGLTAEEIKIEREKRVKSTSVIRNRLGWVERVKIFPEDIDIEAKLTPGSEGNALHATDIKEFTSNGENWIRFETQDKFDKKIKLERKIISKRKYITSKGKKEKRYIIEMEFCIANKYIKNNFSLSDRSMFEYPARLGRDVLAGLFIIDPGSTKTTKPNCKKRS